MGTKFTITTASPIHIGCRVQQVTALESVVYQERCYVVDEQRMSSALLEADKLDKFCSEMQSGFRLKDFLKKENLLNQSFLLENSCYYLAAKGLSEVNGFRPFIRDAYWRPFLPGSSIKGVFRTAVLYGVLKRLRDKDQKEFEQNVSEVVQKKLDEFNSAEVWKKNKAWFKDMKMRSMAADIENSFLQKFNLTGFDGTEKRATSEQRDFLRVLKISDTGPLDKNALELAEVKVISLSKDNEFCEKTSMYVEVIKPGSELEFEISLDHNALNDFKESNESGRLPFNSLQELFEMVKDFSKDVFEYEIRFWDQTYRNVSDLKGFYSKECPNLRIGWGSGLSGTSLLLLLPDSLRIEIRDAFFLPRGHFPFPKSRRVIYENGAPRWPLGWCYLGGLS